MRINPARPHLPVLLKETVASLAVKRGESYIDCSFGFGGHSREILRQGGRVLGIDCDRQSLAIARRDFQRFLATRQLVLWEGNFSQLGEIAVQAGFPSVRGILYDLGLSSWQIEQSQRGFSFQRDEPLDMRANPKLAVTARDLVNALSIDELTKLFQNFGEEPRARKYAQALVSARSLKPIKTTGELLRALGAKPSGREKIHPATRVFQALRIAVNTELLNLSQSLPQAQKLLANGGRLAVISFHSLEDRIVKNFGKDSRELTPVTKSPITASQAEVAHNPRARSAKLRVFEKEGREKGDPQDSAISTCSHRHSRAGLPRTASNIRQRRILGGIHRWETMSVT